jgi:septal ring factor EnvC (AmiA/AmiB activator)
MQDVLPSVQPLPASTPDSSSGLVAMTAEDVQAFWALLQQTQANLQDMIAELEEVNERAEAAGQQAGSLRVQLAASEQHAAALAEQLQATRAK